jgi:short-subunit dehydrogenase
MDLVGRYGPWALVTGGSEGTGSAFVERLADAGVNCIIVARREAPLAVLADRIRSRGVEVVTACIDLSASGAADQVIAAVGEREVGLLITNAGAESNGSPFLDGTMENWESLVGVNIRKTMRLAHHFGQRMRTRRRGGILLVGSGACYGGIGGISVYSGVKAFVLCFGEGLWAELREYGVHVLNLILVRTDTPAHRRNLERKGQAMPAGLASAEDVARTGLEQLPHGPIYNWGQNNEEAGYAPSSPDTRRERILAIERNMRRPL